ncbi:uncharacterized protein BDZ99DRAFT_226241 [Mytilinidion resinicola]|uniref:Uncharacterized protein n=1 Tax=Mytilinidion resinicola TaxID=574789 RepID=A0A6A6YY14_9PEZI|nr:uncharacterized protein BDZ99DRAFT_226241 [Mytilinidion resinicola]KAF2813846.1 hypothetical protein BDZ99DRAFT_226241 [Mytilinidion resinicola]
MVFKEIEGRQYGASLCISYHSLSTNSTASLDKTVTSYRWMISEYIYGYGLERHGMGQPLGAFLYRRFLTESSDVECSEIFRHAKERRDRALSVIPPQCAHCPISTAHVKFHILQTGSHSPTPTVWATCQQNSVDFLIHQDILSRITQSNSI